MLISEFESKIKEIDPDLNIRTNKKSNDIAGIYWNDIYVGIAVPPVEIFEEENKGYIMSNSDLKTRQLHHLIHQASLISNQ